MKKLLFLFVFSVQMFAYSPNDILKSIQFVAQKEGVKPEILYTIVKIESDFKPFVISFLTNKPNADYFAKLQTPNISVKTSPYSFNHSKWVVTINPINEIYAIGIAKNLIQSGFSIDVGLGQLNSVNFDLSEVNYAFNPIFNLTKCAKVLRKCYNAKNKNIKDTIECYNYGMRKRNSNPYYNKFYKNYESFFGNPYYGGDTAGK